MELGNNFDKLKLEKVLSDDEFMLTIGKSLLKKIFESTSSESKNI
jgi:hypothetical protein